MKIFTGYSQDIEISLLFALAPPTLETSGIFFTTTESANQVCHRDHGDQCCITAVIVILGIAKERIGVKPNPQVYSLQRRISAKFHPDRSTFG